ncbi:hypothetical protein HOLleu_36052 [Holothuria leucospilota]|uniref:Uncharacterized protein n=1 Tax=Holothuria leucospilota TaxID=206669 RepID=A0A9Q0YJ77_HOLLE|nr:hypothetical protein HOLleu_36052 [Holothuria leucospilota]
MTMYPQVANVVRSANYHLANISRARKMLTTEPSKLAVHTLVTSRLDYCNSLLIGVSRTLITSLQNAQRTLARIIVKLAKYESITLVLIDLHWPPYNSVSNSKLSSFCTKRSINNPQPISRIYCSFNILVDS